MRSLSAICLSLFLGVFCIEAARGESLVSVVGTDPRLPGARRAIAEGTHARLLFRQDTVRVALGNERILDVELLGPRELLVLGKQTGQSSLTVWFGDGGIGQYVFVVQRDLSILQRALRDIHPGIRAEAAPDRDAVVLRGTVPDVSFSVAAEAAAAAYVEAGASRGVAEPILGASQEPSGETGDPGTPTGAEREVVLTRPGGADARRGRVINLIRVERLPAQLEERMQAAIRRIGGAEVSVERIQRGDVPGASDSFLLSGQVGNQVALVRVLTVAGRLMNESTASIEREIRVVADESGAVARRRGGQEGERSSIQGMPGFGGGSGASFQLRPQDLSNRVRDNIARAKVVELFGGRLLSFIEVEDLPQVRIAVRIYEVSRSRLRQWTPSGDIIAGDVQQGALLPTLGGIRTQGEDAARIGGGGGSDIQNALSLIGGAATNNFQVAGGKYAIDLLFSLLSEAGIARSLATPELLVLSGEVATFQVGGEVPVATSVATGAPDVVFDSVFFVPFGIQLGVRPLVGEDDVITLDVIPQVIEPDFVLTAALGESTGEDPATTAFASRALTTSARLQDGQTLLVGGLLNQRSSDQYAYTPWLHRIPLLGWLARSFDRDEDDQELVIAVSPAIVREPVSRTGLWDFPDGSELLPDPPPAAGNPAAPAGTP